MVIRKTPLAVALCAALLSATSMAQTAPSGDEETAEQKLAKLLDVVSIVGQGETRQIQRLSDIETQRLPPGASPLKILSRLPGVHFTAADPWGNYEWSARLSIRGFSQNQLGFVLDRVPLGDMSYGNFNGLHVSRAVIAENLGTMELAQGSGALDTASTGNLGGSVRVLTANPAYEFGVRTAQTLGSDDTGRSFVRIDSGDHAGWRFYLSALHGDADKWKGWGPQRQNQFNAKLVKDWERVVLSAYVATSRRRETDYADLSLDSARRLGLDWDNYALDWQRAIRAAQGQFEGGVTSLDDAYYLGRGLRDDDLGYVTLDWTPSDTWALVTTGYYHRNEGQGHWITPYAQSPTVPLALRTTEYDIERSGLLPSLTGYFGAHIVEFGVWVERNVHGLQRNFYPLDRDTPPNRAVFARNPTLRVFRQRFDVDTLQYYLQDRVEFHDGRLVVEAGFKGTDVDIDTRSIIGARAEGQLSSRDRFLPQLGTRFRVTDHDELFAAYSENMAAFRAGVNGPFSTSQAAFDQFAGELRPETSRTIEGGYRTVREAFEALVAIYHVRFDDRLLGIARCAGIVGCPGAFANVGSVTTRGAEAGLMLRPLEGLEWYSSISYNDSQYDDDYVDGDTLVRIAGKQVVDAPRTLFSTNLAWRRGGWDASLAAKYTDQRYITYLNDSKVPGFWVADAALGYQIDGLWGVRSVRFQANVTNLFDREYFATVGSNGFVAADPDGLNYTLLAGAPRQVFFNIDVRF